MELRHLILVLALGCNGNGKDAKDVDTDVPPVSFEFNETVSAQAFSANVTEDALAAHRISSALLAATAVVVADEKVQDRLNVDGGGSGFRASYLDCWTRPQFPMFSFSIDYTGCGTYNMGGGVFVEDHPSGPLLFNFENFKIDAAPAPRTVGGTLALDTIGAYPDTLYWKSYNTDGDNPGPDQDPPVLIGVTLDRTLYGAAYEGGSHIDFLAQTWSMWGVMTVEGAGATPITVVHGAATAEEIAPDEPTGDDVLKSSLNWLACRCPTSGISSYDMPLHFTEVQVDLDDLEVDPDELDDPSLVIPIEYDIFGRGVLTHTGCGEYEVAYESDPLSIPVTVDKLVSSISFLCDTVAIADSERCLAFVAAAQALPGDLQIEVSGADANQTALVAVEDEFDTSWCKLD